MQLSNLSPQQLRKAADIKERLDALQEQLNDLLGATAEPALLELPEKPRTARNKKRKLSAAGIANIRAGVAKRMAKRSKPAQAVSASRGAGALPKGNGALTVKAAILKALESGETMGKKDIAQRVSALRRKKTAPNSLNPTLFEMKAKDKTIVSPARGLYRRR